MYFYTQIDLIDMRCAPDDEFKWIGHCVDHFSKFHILFPMASKETAVVAANLVCKVFAYFGLPYILHSDNGKEFVSALIRSIVNDWPGECKIVNGRPRAPWVQGLVERTNACVEKMISAKRHDNNSNDWSTWLPEIQCKNVSVCVLCPIDPCSMFLFKSCLLLLLYRCVKHKQKSNN